MRNRFLVYPHIGNSEICKQCLPVKCWRAKARIEKANKPKTKTIISNHRLLQVKSGKLCFQIIVFTPLEKLGRRKVHLSSFSQAIIFFQGCRSSVRSSSYMSHADSQSAATPKYIDNWSVSTNCTTRTYKTTISKRLKVRLRRQFC